MDFFMRVRKPIMDVMLLFMGVTAAILLSHLMYPLLAYELSGEWTSVGELTNRAVASHEWGAFLALQIPFAVSVCGVAALAQGVVRFVKDFRKALKPDQDWLQAVSADDGEDDIDGE